MIISSIYQKYSITPMLQLHQLRAASVGKCIASRSNEEKEIDQQVIIQTLLLHDMGNIIKFDLDKFPQLLGEEIKNIEYWKKEQQKFREKYGTDEHIATCLIAKEIGASKQVQSYLSLIGVSKLEKIAKSNTWNLKIISYSDLRVGPFGILSVEQRFNDLLERYKGRNHSIADTQKTLENKKYCLEIEKQIQSRVNFNLNAITNDFINFFINELRNYSF